MDGEVVVLIDTTISQTRRIGNWNVVNRCTQRMHRILIDEEEMSCTTDGMTSKGSPRPLKYRDGYVEAAFGDPGLV